LPVFFAPGLLPFRSRPRFLSYSFAFDIMLPFVLEFCVQLPGMPVSPTLSLIHHSPSAEKFSFDAQQVVLFFALVLFVHGSFDK
jgi:hypothetical protein